MMVYDSQHLFFNFVHRPIFDEVWYFGSQLCFPLQAWAP